MVSPQAIRIGRTVPGTKVCLTQAEFGRVPADLQVMTRFFVGLGLNPNVAFVLILGASPKFGYPELWPEVLAEGIAASGKPVEVICASQVGGSEAMVTRGIELARKLVAQASSLRREPVPANHLTVGMKCGLSDASSGIAGNPVAGAAMDMLIDAGGTVLFSETTEVIGAEHSLARRAKSREVAEALLEATSREEARCLAAGIDIRGINPMPFNIAGGISTLEEKSLGAIAKSGSRPLRGVLAYCARPPGPGLYFMEGWEAPHSLFASFAAAGATLSVFQMGGEGLEGDDPPVLAVAHGVVTPTLLITANPSTERRMSASLDFSSASVVRGTETIPDAGRRLFEKLLSTASGKMSKAETLAGDEFVELYLTGPLF